MIKNYIKIAWRSIVKNRLFSLLNILGLSVSLCITLLLLAYTNKEMSFDQMYPKADELYRVSMKTTQEYNHQEWITIPNAIGPAIKKDVPGIIASTRLLREDFGSPASVMVDQQTFIENGIYLADSSIFSMFDFKFVQGNSSTAFKEKNSIVISQSKKEKLFGSKSALNELIYLNQRDTLQITGVFEDLPQNSTLDCEMIYNIKDTRLGQHEYWGNASYETYLQLDPTADPLVVEKEATKLIDKYVEKEDQYFSSFSLQPLKEVHLYSSDFRKGYTSRTGSIGMVKNLLFLAALIALIASINYMNLATARTSRQTKEIGVNKILGANRKQVSMRFYIETFIITLISIVFGFLLCVIILPLFNAVTGIEILISELLTFQMAITLVCCWIVISLLSGSFPAIYMASIKSLNLIGKGHGKSLLIEPARKCLVIFQFSASIILTIAVIVMLLQVNYMKSKDLGYQPDALLSINIKSIKSPDKLETLLNNINQINSVISTTAIQALPGAGESGKQMYKFSTSAEGLPVFTNVVGGPVVKSLGLKLLAGRDLPKTLSKTDTNSYILINEVALAYLGYQNPEEAIGKIIPTGVGPKSIIHGVVGNFHYKSLKENIGGYLFYRMNSPYESIRFLMIRFEQGNTSAFLNQVRTVFNEFNADSAFDYTFIDNHVENQYLVETKTNHIIITFSILAICIASLGLLGLAAFTIEQRSKEIGIRKVLGANVSQITGMLTKGYLKLILIAFIIAAPVSWFALHFWLNNFAYRIEVPWWPFIVSGLIALIITVLTISLQTVNAALSNPVNKLRDE